MSYPGYPGYPQQQGYPGYPQQMGGYPPMQQPMMPMQQPMMGYQQPMMQMQQPMQPMGMGGFPAGYPVFTGALQQNMYYKPIWTPKREMKLTKIWYQVARDGCITYNEIMHILHHFH